LKKYFARIFGVFLVGLFIFYVYSVWRFTASKADVVIRFEQKLSKALEINRSHIRYFFKRFKEYPVLETENIHFWDVKCNQYIWLRTFDGIANVATNPIAEEMRETSWGKWDENTRKMLPSSEERARDFLNPFSGKFDWLAEGADGKLYSTNMARENLLASPPVRVVNIRCPLTASEPPFFEDYSKW